MFLCNISQLLPLYYCKLTKHTTIKMSTVRIELILENIEEFKENIVIKLDGKDMSVTSDKSGKRREELFFPFMERQIAELLEMGSMRTAETYRYALNCFKRFRHHEDIALSDISQDVAIRYERYMKKKNLSLNTISFHMRIMRAAYNKAVYKGLTDDAHPFRHVYTGIPRTPKRALAIQDIRKIGQIHSANPAICYARDMFLFSFYTRGMSFVDMAYLKKTDIKNGWLCYKRHKTGQTICIKWERCMQEVVNRLPSANGIFLLPIIHSSNGKERSQYRYKQNEINRQLKAIALTIRLDSNLTMYVARHSWANIAKDMNAPLDIISNGMGHTSEKTTKIYLKSLTLDKIDKINARIIKMMEV